MTTTTRPTIAEETAVRRANALAVIARETAKTSRDLASVAREANARGLIVHLDSYADDRDGYAGYLATERQETAEAEKLDAPVALLGTEETTAAEWSRINSHIGAAFRAGRRGMVWSDEMCANL